MVTELILRRSPKCEAQAPVEVLGEGGGDPVNISGSNHTFRRLQGLPAPVVAGLPGKIRPTWRRVGIRVAGSPNVVPQRQFLGAGRVVMTRPDEVPAGQVTVRARCFDGPHPTPGTAARHEATMAHEVHP